jgi:hypothetical protein
MKKFCALLVLFVSLFISCSSEPSNERLFKDAVLECYRLTGALFFGSSDRNPNSTPGYNKVSGPNESPAICTDYAVEFVNYWNNTKNYDGVFGRAYFAGNSAVDKIFRIMDGEIVPNGTSNNPYHTPFTDPKEIDSILHDVLITNILFAKPGGVPHFQWNNMIEHMWVVIPFEGNLYATDPTQWDCGPGDYFPYKISYE